MKKLLSFIAVTLCFLSFSMKVNALSTLVNSDFEVSDPTVWTLANVAATNQWFIGTAAFSTGLRSAYITSDGGVTNSYVITTTSTNHMYTSVTFPAGETAILLSFDWRGPAEPSGTGGSTFDYFRVSLMAAAPVGGTFPALAEQLPVIFTGAPGYQKAWVIIPASYAGTTTNLVITWRNDSSLGNSTPGPSIDNVLLTSATPSALSGTLTIPGSYSSFGQAIANLNAHGLGAGGVTFNVAAGSVFNETPPAITVTGTLANQIIFQKSGAGSNPIVNSTGTGNFGPTSAGSVSGGGDASIVINGGDYITFNGIDVSTGNYVGTSSCIEFGYLVRNAAVGDGAQNNVIKNCSISRNRTNTASAGIIQSISTTQGGITPTSAAGANSTNTYTNITVTNSYGGINLLGTAAFPDLSCEISNSTIGASYAGTPTGDIGGLGTATYGISNTAQSGVKIFNNTLRNIASNSTTRGIFISTSLGTNEVYNNQIYGIRSLSISSTSGVNGIDASLSTAADATLRIYNNFVYDLSSAYTGVASATRQLRGILLGSGFSVSASYNVDFNSVYVDGSGSPTISNVGLELGGSTAVNNIRNNIFVNTTGAQTGIAKHYTIRSTGAAAMGGAGSVCNNNVYYFTNTTNGYMGLTNTTDRNALADWITALSGTHPGIDANSWTQNPQYISATNLHINTSSPTPVESNGSYFAGTITWVPNDIDGNSRNATTPDIGADEGTFTALVNNDISATAFVAPLNGAVLLTGSTVTPQASYSNNGLLSQTSVPVKYRILNPSNTEIYNQTGSIASIGAGATSTVTFPVSGVLSTPGTYTIKSYSQLVGDQVTTNDSITGSITVMAPLAGDYTIGVLAFNRFTGKNISFERVVTKVMKEVYENVQNDNSTNKSSEVVSNELRSNSVVKVMKEVEEVSYVPMENGRKYEGPLFVSRAENPNLPADAGVGVFATITEAVNTLNGTGLGSPVRFLLLDATYSSGETFPITINAITGGSSVNTLTIQPNVTATTITGSSALALLKLNGADYVTVDGLNTGGKSLTFNNTNTGGVNVWIASPSALDGSTNNTMRNLISIGPSVAGILSGSGTTLGSDAEFPNSNNTITGCTTKGTQNGMYLRGNTTTVDQNWTVTLNNCGSTVDAEKHTFRGIAMVNCQSFSVSNNSIKGMLSTTTSTSPITGIATFTSTTGGIIESNKIDDIYHQSTSTYGAYGIDLNGVSNTIVKNNFITNVRHNMQGGIAFSTTFGVFGIRIGAGTGYGIYYNSVNLNGTLPGTANSSLLSAALCIVATTSTGCDIRNNILKDSIVGGTTSIAHVSVYMPSGGTSAMNLNWNNNAYYNGSDAARQGIAQVGTVAGTGFYLTSDFNPGAITPSTNFRAYSSTLSGTGTNDNVSFASYVAAPYISNTNLHINTQNVDSKFLNGAAAVIAGITTDIDADLRDVSTPDIGADEFTPLSGLTLKLNWEACPNGGAVTVELRSGSSPYGLIESANGTGGGNVSSVIYFANAASATPYYVVVKSVNSIETWSATTVSFTTSAASYDFTTALSQAYGNNQKLSGGIPSIYQGDANQDGFVNTADVLATYNNSSAFLTAPNTDFNCDGTTDLTDVSLAYNNATNFVQKQRP